MKKKIITAITIVAILALSILLSGCTNNSVDKEQQAQEQTQSESLSQTGTPAIKNFREKKILKDIYEARDQDGLTTYIYTMSMSGQLVYIGEAVGFPVSAGVQFNNPDQITSKSDSKYYVIPQAEPNALYQPSADEGTWVMMLDKSTGKARPVYFEIRIICSPFKLGE